MRLENRTRLRLVRLLLVLSLLVCFGACAKPTRVGVHCPKPTEAEIDDYEWLIYKGSPEVRSAVVWISRVIAYCWPDEAEAERRGD